MLYVNEDMFCEANETKIKIDANIQFAGVMLTMPPELMELYMLYQQELDTRTENDNLIINNANSIMRVKQNNSNQKLS